MSVILVNNSCLRRILPLVGSIKIKSKNYERKNPVVVQSTSNLVRSNGLIVHTLPIIYIVQ